MSNHLAEILYIFVASLFIAVGVSYYLSKKNGRQRGGFRLKTHHILIFVILLYVVLWSFTQYHAFINFEGAGWGWGWDTAIYDQSLWHMSRFEIPYSSLKGFIQLGDHFTVILVFLAPLYWVCSHVLTAIIVQHVVVALGAFPIYFIAKEQLKSNLLGIVFAIAYLLFIGVQKAIEFGFHPITMSPTFLAFTVYFLMRRSWWKYTVFLLLALMCKEDVSVTVGALGLYILVFRRERLVGVLTILVSVIWFVGVTKFIMPQLKGGEYAYFAGPHVLTDIVLHPVGTVSAILSDPGRIEIIMNCILPTLGMCLLSPFIIVAVPVLLVKLYLPREILYTMAFHHGAPLAATITISAIFGLANLQRLLSVGKFVTRKKTFFALYVTIFCIALSLTYHVPIRISRIYKPGHPAWQDHNKARWEVLGELPDSSSVSTDHVPFPMYLSHRNEIYTLDQNFDALYVLIDTKMVRRNGRMYHVPGMDEELALRIKTGYKTVVSRDGVYLLKRGDVDTGIASY